MLARHWRIGVLVAVLSGGCSSSPQERAARFLLVSATAAAAPHNVAAALMLAMLEESSTNYTRATAQYRRVLELDESNVLALNNLAFLLAEHTGEFDHALHYAQRVKEPAPDSMPAVDDTLGWIYYKRASTVPQSATYRAPSLKNQPISTRPILSRPKAGPPQNNGRHIHEC